MPAPIGHRRADTLPEHVHYHDTGCSVSPSCFTCPLVQCRYEEEGGVRAALKAERDPKIIAMRDQGLAPREIARALGITARTVIRVTTAQRRKQ